MLACACSSLAFRRHVRGRSRRPLLCGSGMGRAKLQLTVFSMLWGPFCGRCWTVVCDSGALGCVLAPVIPPFLKPPSPQGCLALPWAPSSVFGETLSCWQLKPPRCRKWLEDFTAGGFVLSHFPAHLPPCKVPSPRALTGLWTISRSPGEALERRWGWRPAQSVSGRKGALWLPCSAAQKLSVPWGSPRGCPSIHDRSWASMHLHLQWCFAPLLSPVSDCTVGPACSVQLLCA